MDPPPGPCSKTTLSCHHCLLRKMVGISAQTGLCPLFSEPQRTMGEKKEWAKRPIRHFAYQVLAYKIPYEPQNGWQISQNRFLPGWQFYLNGTLPTFLEIRRARDGQIMVGRSAESAFSQPFEATRKPSARKKRLAFLLRVLSANSLRACEFI